MSAAPTTSPEIGLLLDARYRIGEPIARGGMATVHRGWDERLERTVALKIMHPHLATDPEFLRRFTREARSAARLSHPSVVSVFDQGEDQGLVYLAMEIVEGETLRARLAREGRLRIGEALRIGEQVLEALAVAHRAGIIHRDVKPENILLAEDGRAKVADFGLARAVGASTASASGTLLGTVAYISPEVVTRGHCDERSDVYSFGVVLYEMLAGGQPYTGELPVHVAFQHVHEDMPAPSARTPSVPAGLDALVTWACARSAASRPADAAELLASLRELRREIPVGVQQQTPLVAEETDTRGTPRITASLEDAALEHDAPARAFPGPDAHLRLPLEADRLEAAGDDSPHSSSRDGQGAETADPRVLTVRPPRSRRGRHLRPGVRRPARGMRALAAISAVLALVGLGWGAVHWYGTAGPGGDRHVPVVAGTALADAETVLTENDLGTRTRTVYDDSVPAGHVVAVAPAAGSVVKRDSDVLLSVSAGPQRFPVPDVRGQALEDARTAVGKAGLTLVEDSPAYDEKVPAGSIASQSAASDTLPAGGEVHVVVSRGPQPIAVPDVRGRAQADAEAALTAQGFRTSVSQQYSSDAPAGSVVSQDAAGGSARRGATISLVVSQGPEMATVPDVFQKPEADAVAALQAAGFTANVVHDKGTPVFGLVYEQSVAGGTQQPKGTTVTIKVF